MTRGIGFLLFGLSLSFGAFHDLVGGEAESSQELCRMMQQVEKERDFEVDARAGRYIEVIKLILSWFSESLLCVGSRETLCNFSSVS